MKRHSALAKKTGKQTDSNRRQRGSIILSGPTTPTRTIEVNEGFLHHEAYRAWFEVVGWEFIADKRSRSRLRDEMRASVFEVFQVFKPHYSLPRVAVPYDEFGSTR